jgi:pimeloyl-ACP methyl ester carboxylesterase
MMYKPIFILALLTAAFSVAGQPAAAPGSDTPAAAPATNTPAVAPATDTPAPATDTLPERTISIPVTGLRLEGSLLAPENNPQGKIALLIAGSGPTDRNGNSGTAISTDTYKLLAGELAKQHIASYRYDKRGVPKNKNFSEKDVVFDTYIQDAEKTVDYLRDSLGFKQIFIIGHSEGSLIGMVVSARKPVTGYVSLSGAGRPIDVVIREQLATQPDYVKSKCDSIITLLKKGQTVDSVPPYLNALFRPSIQPYAISLFRYDPAAEIKKLACPVLILQGACDIQVRITDAQLLQTANPRSKLDIIPAMTHTLKDAGADCKDDNMRTYKDRSLPLDTRLVKDIVDFIHTSPSAR